MLHLFSYIINLASRIVVLFFYAAPVTFMAPLSVLAYGDYIGSLYFPLGLIIFVIHAFYTKRYNVINWSNFWNDKATFRVIFTGFFNLLLSFSLAIFVLSFVSSSLREVLMEVNKYTEDLGEIMSMLVYILLGLFLILLMKSFIEKRGDKPYLYALSLIFVILFIIGLNLLENLDVIQKIGIYLLGPINLLIVGLLFNKSVQSLHSVARSKIDNPPNKRARNST